MSSDSSTGQTNSMAPSSSPSNRFEQHSKLTLAVVLALLLVGCIATVEVSLRLLKDRLDLRVGEIGHTRALGLREWPPGTRETFAAPYGRSNDPTGPVDKYYELRIDQEGFIWPSLVHALPDLEIVFLGGSTTECLYVRPQMRFPHLVGRLLEQQTGLKINSINAGRSGNNSMHALVNYLGKVAPRRPRYVVLMEAINDIGILNAEKTYWKGSKGLVLDELHGDGLLMGSLKKAVRTTIPYTAQVVRAGLSRILSSGGRDKLKDREVVAADRQGSTASGEASSAREAERRQLMREFFEPSLRSFARLAKAWGSEPVLMTQVRIDRNAAQNYDTDFLAPEALRRGDFDRATFGSLHDYANDIIREVAASEGAVLIDLAAARRWTSEDTYDAIHFTETGSRHAAEIIAQALTPLLVQAETPSHR